MINIKGVILLGLVEKTTTTATAILLNVVYNARPAADRVF